MLRNYGGTSLKVLGIVNRSRKMNRSRRWLLRTLALSVFLLYLVLGPLAWLGEPPAARSTLPMRDWSLSDVEQQSVLALNVVARQAVPAPTRFLPDMRPVVPVDVYTVGSRAEGNLRLKFDTTIWNAGLGPLETRGARNPETDRLEVYQYVYQQTLEGRRAVQARPVGTFDYNQRHGHLHFDDFAHYSLWSLDAQGRRRERLATNAKVGFCLMDIKDMSSGLTHLQSGRMGTPGGPVYAGCREDIQGVSVGWGDEYLALLYEQDLELTGIPDGEYDLMVMTNPARRLEELDYENNTAVVGVRLEAGEVVELLPRPQG